MWKASACNGWAHPRRHRSDEDVRSVNCSGEIIDRRNPGPHHAIIPTWMAATRGVGRKVGRHRDPVSVPQSSRPADREIAETEKTHADLAGARTAHHTGRWPQIRIRSRSGFTSRRH